MTSLPSPRTGMLASVLVALCAVLPLSAQTTGATLQGVVADEQGGVVPGASVTVTNVETGWTRTVTTDERGWYRAAALPVGSYEIRVELTGFATVIRSGLTLTTGQEATVNLALQPATVQETLNVVGDAPLVEMTRSDIGTTVTRSQLDSMPLAGRNFAGLATLAPGVASVGSAGIAAGGQISRNNTFLIDGTSHDNNVIAGDRGTFSLETVREFQVMANQFQAEYGQASGAIVSVVTRSGTNQVQGRTFVFHRDDAFDAQDVFSKAQGSGKAPFSQQQYGGFIGGPIRPDRLHYFASYERLRRRETSVVTSPIVPVSEREIPRNTDGHLPFVKVDWRMTENHGVAVRYRRDAKEIIGEGIGGLNTRERGYDRPTRFSDVYLSQTSVLSNRALNEFRAQYALRYDGFQDTYSSHTTPNIVRPSGNFGKPNNLGGYVDEDRFQIVNNFAYSRGKHDLKTGADISVIRAIDFFAPNLAGTFQFRTDAPFDANDPSTYPFLFTQAIADPRTLDDNEMYSFFVQDTWRVRSHLTFNIGVRYDRDTAVSRATQFPSGRSSTALDHPVIPDDKDNLSPRLGFVWDPFRDGRTAIRGGYGVYHDQVFMNITGNAQYAMRAVDVTVQNPGYPDPLSRGTLAPTLSSARRIASDFATPYTRTVSFGLKREIVSGLAASADLVYSRGFNLFSTRDVNYVGPGRFANTNFLRIDQYETQGQSWFHGVLLGLERRAGAGPAFGVSYTLSRAMRDVEDFGFRAQDPLNVAAEKSLANGHRRHQVAMHATWLLPRGFQIGAVAQARSGQPWTITTGTDNNGDTQATDRPDLVNPGGSVTDPATYFGAFTGRVGNLGRNTAIGPAYFQLDARVSKFVRLSGIKMEGFIEAFNLTNRANFGSPVGNLRSVLFGRPTTLAGTPRQLEIGFRLDF